MERLVCCILPHELRRQCYFRWEDSAYQNQLLARLRLGFIHYRKPCK